MANRNPSAEADSAHALERSTEFQIQPLGADESDYLSIVGESLLNYGPEIWKAYLDRVGRENTRTISIGGRCLGGLTFYRMGHWFGGKAIPTAGISGVAIDPAHRGTGTCRALLEGVMQEIYEEGFPLASLYASTQTLYRKVGFEQAGTQTLYSLPIASIAGGHDRSCPIERLESVPWDRLQPIARQRAELGNGQLERTAGLWQRMFAPNNRLPTKVYLLGDSHSPEGFVVLQANNPANGVPQPLIATDWVVTTGRALERLLALIRDHRSIYETFQWYGAPQDPLIFAADEHRTKVIDQTRWMERILRVPEALSQRGYRSGVRTTLELQIVDDLFPANTGNWQVQIADGAAQVSAGGQGGLRMSVGTLAPLFTGYYSASELAQIGRIETSDRRQLAAADQAFAGPAPWMPEVF